MAKHSKYEKEYTRLRENIMSKQRNFLNKGYTPKDSLYKLPTFKQLSKAPSKQTIERLRRINKKEIYEKFEGTITEPETGKQITTNIFEVQKFNRKQAAKQAAYTKKYGKPILSESQYEPTYAVDDYEVPFPGTEEAYADEFNEDFPESYTIPFIDEEVYTSQFEENPNERETILYNVKEKIYALYGWKSGAASKYTAERSEKIVSQCADKILENFENAERLDPNKLALQCAMYAAQINRLIDEVTHAYQDPEAEDAIITELADIFIGVYTVEDAMQYTSDIEPYDGGEFNEFTYN